MTFILTSSPCVVGCPDMNPANGLAEAVRQALPPVPRALFVCSDPDTPERTDGFAEDMRHCFRTAGIRFAEYTVLDGRNAGDAERLIRGAELEIGRAHV